MEWLKVVVMAIGAAFWVIPLLLLAAVVVSLYLIPLVALAIGVGRAYQVVREKLGPSSHTRGLTPGQARGPR
ncbi:MAG: hypothetical protein Q8O76_00655 [Chloroflexota bacterium]|nr:hypothetical protein [Chloroflexota bacterium]